MRKIKKIDAFSLVVRTLENGDEKNANRMFRIITDSILQNKKSLNIQHYITVNDKDASLFKELISNGINE